MEHILDINREDDPVVEQYQDEVWDIGFGNLVVRLSAGQLDEVVKQYLSSNPVVVRVENGVVEVDAGPPSVAVIIRDYDVEGLPESDTLVDQEGQHYTERS